MADKKINLLISARDAASGVLRGISTEASKATRGMSGAFGEVGRAASNFGKSMIGSVLGGMTVFSIASTAISKLKSTITDAINAVINKAADMEKMRVVVEMSGEAWGDMKPRISEALAAIKEFTAFSGGELRSALTNLAVKTGDMNTSLEQMPLIADMASSGLMDLEGASMAVAMALEGETGRLGRLLPEMKNMNSELGENASRSEKAEWILGKLNDRFGGMAQNIDSSKERINKWNRAMKESKANAVEPLLPAIDALTEGLMGLNRAMSDDKKGKIRSFFGAIVEGYKNATPAQSFFLNTLSHIPLAGQIIGPIAAVTTYAIKGGESREKKKEISRINTRNEELKNLLDLKNAGDELTKKQLDRIKVLSTLREQERLLQEAHRAGKVTDKEYAQSVTMLSQAQFLRGNIVKKIGASKTEGVYTKQYLEELDKLDASAAKKIRDRSLKDLQERARLEKLNAKEIAAERLAINQKYYETVRTTMGLKSPMTAKAAADFVSAREYSESLEAKSGGGSKTNKDSKAKSEKAAKEAAAAKKKELAEIQKQQKEAFEAQRIAEENIRNMEERERANREAAAKAQSETRVRIEERVVASRATGISALRIQLSENEKLLNELKAIAGTEERIRDLNVDIARLKWDISDAEKEIKKSQVEADWKKLWTGAGPAMQGVVDAAIVNPAEVKKKLADVEATYQQTLKDIETSSKYAGLTGEQYDPISAKIDALKRKAQALGELGQSTVNEDQEIAIARLQSAAIDQAKQNHDELKNTVSDAISTGMNEGAAAGFRGLMDAFKNKFKQKIVDALSDAVVNGIGKGNDGAGAGGGIGTLLSGGGGGNKANPFAAGWAAMSDKLSGGASTATGGAGGGGFFKKLLGGGGGLFGSPLGLGLGAIAMLGGLFGKKSSPTFSGVEQIFSGINARGGDFGGLYGSDVFERATFSSRNRYNDVLRSGAGTRGAESTVKIVPSKEFDAISEDKWVQVSRMNEIKGVPNRTGFNHG